MSSRPSEGTDRAGSSLAAPLACLALGALLSCGRPGVPAGNEVGPTRGAAVLPDVAIPEIAWDLPARVGRTPAPAVWNADLRGARRVLAAVVREHGREPGNPWAVGHALLAEGPDMLLEDGRPALDWLFADNAEVVPVAGLRLIGFPREREGLRVEPHTDQLLALITAAGVLPDREVRVGGERFTVGDLYRRALVRAWVDGEEVSYGAWNDTPWALRGIAAWAPRDLAWTAQGGHAMTVDAFTSAVVGRLVAETAFLRDAMERGEDVDKRKQGIFAYTCGGAHLVQGAGYAVARGHGTASDRAAMGAQIPVLFYRLDLELAQADDALARDESLAILLLEQRLKFLGHFLETAHTLAATGIFEPDEVQREALARALRELVGTVAVLDGMGVLSRLDEVRVADEQTWLDFVGDSAHAVRGIDLATGEATVLF